MTAPSMRLRTYDWIALLLPLVGLGLAVALHNGDAELAAGLGPGGTARWLYPTSPVRGLLAYGVVALWLMRSLRRAPDMFAPLLWRAPLAYVAANIALLTPLVLIQGRAPEFFSEHGGRAGLRLVAHLVFGFGYVGLVMFARERLRLSDTLEPQERAAD